MCDIQSVFGDTLNTLDAAFPDIWASIVSKAPLRAGITFGSCYTACGSLGIVNVTSLDLLSLNLTLDADGPQATFTTCNITDQAILIVPFTETILDVDLLLRATGVGHIWPTSTNEHTHNARLGGHVVITVPSDENWFHFTRPMVSVKLKAVWTDSNPPITSWPNQNSPLFDSVPTSDILEEYMRTLNEYVAPKLERQIHDAIQMENVPKACSYLEPIIAECRASTVGLPTSSCHPCDKCCICMMEQRCNKDCDKCPCVKCTPSAWRFFTFFITFIIFVTSILLLAWLYPIASFKR